MANRASGNFDTPADLGNPNGKLFDSSASRRKILKALAMAGAGAILPGSGAGKGLFGWLKVTSPSVRALPGPD